ncbi:MAG: hypothetical protein ACXW1Y_05140, partial [Acidimicrobiia bacterium]
MSGELGGLLDRHRNTRLVQLAVDVDNKVNDGRRLALSLLPTWAVAVVFFVFVSGRMVPGMAVVTSAARPGARAAFMTLNGSVMQIGSGFAATLSGALIQRLPSGALQNYHWVGWIAALTTLVAIW